MTSHVEKSLSGVDEAANTWQCLSSECLMIPSSHCSVPAMGNGTSSFTLPWNVNFLMVPHAGASKDPTQSSVLKRIF